jgi:predicted MFS family arabinose efflux permease
VGGWLIDTMGWRVIFVINIPIALAAGFLVWQFVAEQNESARDPRLDFRGAAAATVALALLTWSLTEAAGSHRSSHSIWITLAGGLVFLGVFIWQESRLADRALMPLALFSSSSFVGLTLLTFFLYGSLGGLFVLLPFVLIQMHHWSAVAAGTALLPIPLLIGIGSKLMGRVTARVGGRIPLSCGSLLVAIGLALFGRVGANEMNYWIDIFPPTLLVAMGMGMSVSPLTTSVMASVDTDHVGIASGLNNTVARIAGLVATALLGLVFSKQDSISAFAAAFRTAALLGAGSAMAAGVFTFTLLPAGDRKLQRPPPAPSQP